MIFGKGKPIEKLPEGIPVFIQSKEEAGKYVAFEGWGKQI